MVAPFGAALHVASRDAPALDALAARLGGEGPQVWRRDQATLEDVFIALMNRSQDNFR